MHLLIRLPLRAAWKWQEWLIEDLRRDDGHTVEVDVVDDAPSLPAGCQILLWLEQIAFRLDAERPACPITPDELRVLMTTDHADPAEFDCVLDLTSAASIQPLPCRTIAVRYCGRPGINALMASLLDHELPWISLADTQDASPGAASLVALSDPAVLSRSLDDTFARVGEVILKALRRPSKGAHVEQEAPPQEIPGLTAKTISFAATGIASKIGDRLARLARSGPLWQVGLRKATEWRALDRLDPGAFNWLRCEPKHLLADPFLFEWKGQRHLFAEDYSCALSKAVIAAMPVSNEGVVGRAEVVLDEPFHLSYPFLFESDGQVYMLPETSGAGQIRLYRAESFPYKWVLHAVLIDGIRASDPTLVAHNGRLWMFLSTPGRGNRCDWGALSLFHASRLLGPWQPHPANPVLIDAGCARPAGNMRVAGGQIHRVAQDCRTGYGAGLAYCRVTRLDEEHFAQVVDTRFRPHAVPGVTALHTHNHIAGFELIDALMPLYQGTEAPAH